MTLYTLLVALHVIAAVAGGGLVFALVLVANGPAVDAAVPALIARLQRLLRANGVALGLLIVTGVAAAVVAGGAMWSMRWLKLSMGLAIVLGAIGGVTQARLRRSRGDAGALRAVGRVAWVMSAIVAAIAFLMAAKPF